MPLPTNGVRGGTPKRRDTMSEQKKNQGVDSSSSHDLSRRENEELQTPVAVLASSSEALKRLAAIAQYFESSHIHDIDVVEETYGTEMEKDSKIRSLNETVDTLTHSKSEELKNLQRENTKLKAKQEACDEKIKKCQGVKEKLEAQNDQAEANRQAENKRKLQEETTKLHKHFKTEKAELEGKLKQDFQKMAEQHEKLSAAHGELSKRYSEAEEKLETKKIRHARMEKSLEDENKKLTVELSQIKAEFPVDGQPIENYAHQFRQISDAVKALSLKYFQKLPEQAMKNPDSVHQELNSLSPVFDATPIWPTPISEFLRMSNVQHIISACLCDSIWQPFLPQDSHPNHPGVGGFLEALSESLSTSGSRSESVWRILTLRGISALDGFMTDSSHIESTAQRVLGILRPLTIPTDSAELNKALVSIISQSVTLWEAAQKDAARILIVKQPDASDKEEWQAEDMSGLGETSIPPGHERIDAKGVEPLCLFPSILHINPQGERAVLHQGSALFPTSRVCTQAILEKSRHEEELEKELLDARSRFHARRISVPSGPNSPMGGRVAMAQI